MTHDSDHRQDLTTTRQMADAEGGNEDVVFTRDEIRAVKAERNKLNMDRWLDLLEEGDRTWGFVFILCLFIFSIGCRGNIRAPEPTPPFHSTAELAPAITLPLSAVQGAALWRTLHDSARDPRFPAVGPGVAAMSDAQVAAEMDGIVATLEAVMAGGEDRGWFVKMYRSAKDATAESDVARDAFLRRLAAAGDEADDDLSLNEKLVLLYRAQVDALLVRNAREAVSQLQASKRIAFDLALDLHFYDDDAGESDDVNVDEMFTQAIYLRPFVDVAPEQEFRVFVSDGRMTAASQYFTQLYFPELKRRKEVYLDAIKSYGTSIIAKLSPLRSYVLDLCVVVGDDDVADVRLIELNPFDPSTGAALYSWDTDYDFLDGSAPLSRFQDLELKINEEPPTIDVEGDLYPAWREWLGLDATTKQKVEA